MESIKTGWKFFQDEILGMQWLNRLIGSLLDTCGLDTTGKIRETVQFFLYDTIKIIVFLGVLLMLISNIQSYFLPERTKKILGRFHGIGANIMAALLGTVTPFCFCSSIPLFIGFISARLPLCVTFSFLISSPMVDLGSLVLLMSIFGWKVTIMYVVLGLVKPRLLVIFITICTAGIIVVGYFFNGYRKATAQIRLLNCFNTKNLFYFCEWILPFQSCYI